MSRPTPDWAKSYDALRRDDLTKKVEDYFTEGRIVRIPFTDPDTVTVLRADLESILYHNEWNVPVDVHERLYAALEESR